MIIDSMLSGIICVCLIYRNKYKHIFLIYKFFIYYYIIISFYYSIYNFYYLFTYTRKNFSYSHIESVLYLKGTWHRIGIIWSMI